MVDKSDFRTKWRYRKKSPRYRKPLIMEVQQALPMAHEITSNGLELATLPKGHYEIRIISHPNPAKRGRDTKWVVVNSNGHVVGFAKNFVRVLQRQGLVRIFIPDGNPPA